MAESNLKGLHPKCFSDSEEEQLAKEVERDLKRQQYEKDHWDEAIVGFRECEKKHWSPSSQVWSPTMQWLI